MGKFEKLKVWQEAHKLVLEIYRITKSFPKEEKYSLVDQIRRSAKSVATNIVEGNSRRSKKEFLQFLYLSRGSLEETKYHLLLSKDLNYIDAERYEEVIDRCETIGSFLAGLINYLKKSS